MTMVCGLDLHRRQITFDAVEVESGRGGPAGCGSPIASGSDAGCASDVPNVPHGGPVAIAVEGCTGWRYVVEEVVAAGFEAHLAEPADTQAARGRKRHAKTDRSDSRLLRELLADGRLPESWIPPTVVLEWRERVRLYKTLVDQRSTWVQRIHAELFQHGVTLPETSIRWAGTGELLDDEQLEIEPRVAADVTRSDNRRDHDRVTPVEGRHAALRSTSAGLSGTGRQPVRDRRLLAVAMRSSSATVSFSRSEQVVRHSGLDVTVDALDRRRAGGFLSVKRRYVAGGAVRSRPERVPSAQPGPRRLRQRQRAPQQQAGDDLNARNLLDAASTCRAWLIPDRLRNTLRSFVEVAVGTAQLHITGHLAVSSATGAHANIRPGRPSNIDATVLPPSWGTPDQEMPRRRRTRRALR